YSHVSALLSCASPVSSFTLSCPVTHRVLHSFPTRRSSDLRADAVLGPRGGGAAGAVGPRAGCTARGRGRGRRGRRCTCRRAGRRSEEHTSELQSRFDLVCRLLLEKKNYQTKHVQLA